MTPPRGRRAVIAGVATSDYPHLPDLSEHAVHGQAADRALADAGLTFADVDGFATTGFFPMYATGVAEYLGLHPIYFDETNSGGSSFEVLVEHAAYAVECGAAEVVLVTYGSIQLSQMGRRLGTGGGGGGGMPGPAIYDALWGNTLVGNYAMAARRHMHEFGTTPEQLAAVAVSMRAPRRHQPPGPRARARSPSTTWCRRDWWPTRCTSSTAASSPTAGGACVVTTEERAADLRQGAGVRPRRGARHHAPPQPVGHARPHRHPRGPVRARGLRPGRGHSRTTSTWPSSTTRSPSPWCSRVEDLGFCAKGEGGAFVEDGGLEVGGRLPDQHRRRRPVGLPPRDARHVPHRRGGAPAARRGRGHPGPRRPASPWRTAPAACCRPAPPSCSDGRHHDRSHHRARRRRAPPQAPPGPDPRRRLRAVLDGGPRRAPGACSAARAAAPASSTPATGAACAGARSSGSRRAGGARVQLHGDPPELLASRSGTGSPTWWRSSTSRRAPGS